jgi:hypothetical protein
MACALAACFAGRVTPHRVSYIRLLDGRTVISRTQRIPQVQKKKEILAPQLQEILLGSVRNT